MDQSINSAPQNGVFTPSQEGIKKTYEKALFPTNFYSFVNPDFPQIKDTLLALFKQRFEASNENDIMDSGESVVEEIKKLVFDIAKQLPEFEDKIPVIIGSNPMFQQLNEHTPIHAYEHIPLVFTFVLNSGDYRPKIYYADPRGGVQTINRNRVANGIVETSFSLQAYEGEILITPGYLQRYTESNLSTDTFVTLDVLVGFVKN